MVSDGDICKVFKASASVSSLPSSQQLAAEVGSLVRVVNLSPQEGLPYHANWAWCRDTYNREGFVPITSMKVILLSSEVDKRGSIDSNISDHQMTSSHSPRSSAVGRPSFSSGYREPSLRPDSSYSRTLAAPVVTDELDSIYGEGADEYVDDDDEPPDIRPRKSLATTSTRESPQRPTSKQSQPGSGQLVSSRSSALQASSVRAKSSRISSDDGSNTTSSLSPRESCYQAANEDPDDSEQSLDLGRLLAMDEEPEVVLRSKTASLTKDCSTQTSWIALNAVKSRPTESVAELSSPGGLECPSDSWMPVQDKATPILSDLEVELRRKTDNSSSASFRFSDFSKREENASPEAAEHDYAEIGSSVSDGEDEPDYAILASHTALTDRPDSNTPFPDVELRRHSSRPPSERSWFSRASVQSNEVPAMFSLDALPSRKTAANSNFLNQLQGTLSPSGSNRSKRVSNRTSTNSQASQTSDRSAVADLDKVLASMGSLESTSSSSLESSPQNTPEVVRKHPVPRMARARAPSARPTSFQSGHSSPETDAPVLPVPIKRIPQIRIPRREIQTPDLTTFAWFVGNSNRQETQKILTDPSVENDTFLVRRSDRVEGYVISIKTSRQDDSVKLRHRKIRYNKGLYTAWSPQGFFSIPDLVDAHCSEKGGHKLKIPFDKDNFVPSLEPHPSLPRPATGEGTTLLSSDSDTEPQLVDIQQLMRPPQHRSNSSPMPSLVFSNHSSSESESDKEENKEEGEGSPSQVGVPWRTPDQWVVLPGEVKRLELVKQGRCGELWKAKFRKNQTIIGMKVFNSNIVKVKDFVTDTSVLRDINHPALAKMLGVHSDPKKTFLLVVYYPLGSIREYFSKGRKLTDKQLQLITSEVTAGMEYLAKLEFTHRDLAARNVLLANDFTPKITDYGLSRLIKPEIKKQLDSNMFWKWLAPEVLGPRMTWSSKSDVWSYGVFCWELYTECANQPYPGISARADLIRHLEAGNRLPKPESCSGFTFEVMSKCWEVDPVKRITFSDIQLLQNVLLKY